MCSALPGLLAGTHVAGLVFFLNPHLPFEAGPLTRTFVAYAMLAALLSIAVHLPLTRLSDDRARRFLPWALSLVFAIAALGDWVHASVFAYYLPPGINSRLLKAAAWLSLGAVVAFYTALLHALHRRPYGLRSRLGLGVLAVLSIYMVLERREAFRPPPEPQPRATSIATAARPHLLVIGLEGASLDAILPLAEQGQLPFLSTLVQGGAYARLTSLRPPRQIPLWATLATGKYPYQHGIVTDRQWLMPLVGPDAALRLLPLAMAFSSWGTAPESELKATAQQQALSFWEVTNRLGLRTEVIGWPGLGEETCRSQSEHLVDRCRIEKAHRVLQRDSPPQVLLLVLSALRSTSDRHFRGYASVQFDGAQDDEAKQSADALTAYYAELDGDLSTLWEQLPEPRSLVVLSAFGSLGHGFWDVIEERLFGERISSAPDGAFLMRGLGVRAGVFAGQMSLVDVAPTLLYGLRLPLAKDFDGQLHPGVYDAKTLAATPLTFVASYENVQPLTDQSYPIPTP